MNEIIISDLELMQYAFMLLLLSPFVFTTLYLIIRYSNPTRYKKKKKKE